MGNDMSVFEEGELERDFWKAHGPKNESCTEFLSRSFAGLSKILMQPKRMEYGPKDVESHSEDTDFRHEVLTIPADDNSERSTSVDSKSSAKSTYTNPLDLAAVLWQQGRHRLRGVPRPLILYLHTNTRSLVDAKEVLPLCDALGASLLAFDLPGCGHSEGNLTFQMTQDLHRVVQHARFVLGFEEFILWARGMSTALAVEYCSSRFVTSRSSKTDEDRTEALNTIKFVVLDTPYTSVKQMVVDGSKAIKCYGLSVPETLVRLGCHAMRGKVSSHLGSDPFDLKPLRLLESVASSIKKNKTSEKLPHCCIFAAQQDDYIPTSHGHNMKHAWEAAGSNCKVREFAGRHFGQRETGMMLEIENEIKSVLVFDKKAEEVASLSSLDLNTVFMESSASSAKIPWAGVW